ncbi:NADPH-dependent FMN reductase [Roseitranquillus sediminis]|uniref:NADPH-dependent FMN reductase n=1 Tax=Roseitranquillus sediminis TaxID=2809051 RepID=UPI001D0C65AB|nr:NAD(P)H-dependent oxidoreductase [Roseitranquillus sediminis]MBM9595259.1 NAD(P)H-dependent oxidoreductase [Roseitranquillus sediminis]
MSLRLHVVTASTRPGRIGPVVAGWFKELAEKRNAFDVRGVDLADYRLPVFDEPNHPRSGKYENETTRRWSEAVDSADAYVFVTPEYNHGPTPALVNAMTFLSNEWAYKPAAFVSYGGMSGGRLGVQATKPMLNTLKMVPLLESVTIPMVMEHVSDGRFAPNEAHVGSANAVLDELQRWAEALRPMREAA